MSVAAFSCVPVGVMHVFDIVFCLLPADNAQMRLAVVVVVYLRYTGGSKVNFLGNLAVRGTTHTTTAAPNQSDQQRAHTHTHTHTRTNHGQITHSLVSLTKVVLEAVFEDVALAALEQCEPGVAVVVHDVARHGRPVALAVEHDAASLVVPYLGGEGSERRERVRGSGGTGGALVSKNAWETIIALRQQSVKICVYKRAELLEEN